MSLETESVDELVAAMNATKKGLKAARSEGGYFYFLGDAKGKEAALIVFDKKKDSDGKKTLRIGRSLLKVFRKGGVKARYSYGAINPGSALVFSIEKGNAKPAILKFAFKKSTMLHDGVGSSMVGTLKGVKFQMASQNL